MKAMQDPFPRHLKEANRERYRLQAEAHRKEIRALSPEDALRRVAAFMPAARFFMTDEQIEARNRAAWERWTKLRNCLNARSTKDTR